MTKAHDFHLVPQRAVGSSTPKEIARLSFTKRNLFYVWLTADIEWSNADVRLAGDFSSIILARREPNQPSYVVRPPQGNKRKYPCIHIRPVGFKVKPFSLVDASSYIVKKDYIAIGIPKEVRGNFSRIS